MSHDTRSLLAYLDTFTAMAESRKADMKESDFETREEQVAESNYLQGLLNAADAFRNHLTSS